MDRLLVMTLVATVLYLAGLVGLTAVIPADVGLKTGDSIFFLSWVAFTAVFGGLLRLVIQRLNRPWA